MPRHGTARGFTLIELAIALVIAVLLLSMALPSFEGAIARARLEGAITALGADLQYARAETVRRRESVTLRTGRTGTDYTVGTATLALRTVALPAGVTLSADTAISFDALRATANADATLDGRSSRSSARLRVALTAIGRLRLCSPDDSFRGYPAC